MTYKIVNLQNWAKQYVLDPHSQNRGSKCAVPTAGGNENNYNEVYPGLFLGDRKIAMDKNSLKELGITHVINCAQGQRSIFVNTDAKYYKDMGIKFYGIKASDTESFDISKFFRPTANIIQQALEKGGKVLVHCVSGVSRSATIIIAFLMLKRRMAFREAIKSVREKRCICPNDGFMTQLCVLHHELFGVQELPNRRSHKCIIL